MKPTGYVFYQGPSALDGAPIVAIAITGSTNRKTGNMVQTYILRSDVAPCVALKTGQDSSVCGNCRHRPANGGACYVVVAQGPTSVYGAFRRSRYPQLTPRDCAQKVSDRMVRLGTYGDPAAVPVWVWRDLLSTARGWTGYTHQWARWGKSTELKTFCQASVDTPLEYVKAHAMGWRTFRVRADGAPILQGEFMCPASEEAGKRLQCHECGACDGVGAGGKRASPVIVAHGAKASRFNS